MSGYPKFRSFAFCFLSAALLGLAFPPVHWNYLAWGGLIPLWLALDGTTLPGAFGRGYLFGFLFFLGTIWWIGHVTIAGMLLMVAYLALYSALFGVWYRFVAGYSFGARAILVPAAYVTLEFVRDHAFTGFGWAGLGHTQAALPALLYLSAWSGVAGISFLVVFGNLVAKEWLAVLYRRERPNGVLLTATVFFFLVFAGGAMIYTFRYAKEGSLNLHRNNLNPSLPQATVALVQPNVPLGEMWTSSSKPRVVRKLLALSRAALKDKPDLIIWPETSFPHFYWELKDLFDEVKAFARQNKVSLLIGAVTQEGDKYYNSALLIKPDGQVGTVYNKRHLVVFGEYIPFRKELPFLASIVPIDDFTPGNTDVVFTLPNGVRFSVLICFEDTIPELARRDIAQGADFLVNLTNDAWFGDSGQQRMHLENALFRAVENHRPLVRSTNTGESCGVSPAGRVGPCIADASGKRVGAEGVTVIRLGRAGGTTFYTKYGDVFTLACGIGILIFMMGRLGNSRRRKSYG